MSYIIVWFLFGLINYPLAIYMLKYFNKVYNKHNSIIWNLKSFRALLLGPLCTLALISCLALILSNSYKIAKKGQK